MERIPPLIALLLIMLSEVYRFTDLENHLFLLDFTYSTIIAGIWAVSKLTQFLSFYKYMNYNMNPIRAPFVSAKSQAMFLLAKRLRPLIIFLEFASISATIVYAAKWEQYRYTPLLIRTWMGVYLISSVYQSFCGWLLYSSIIGDINMLLETPSLKNAENLKSTESLLLQRRKELRIQRRFECVLKPLNCIALIAGIFGEVFFAMFVYLMPWDMTVFSLRTPIQLRYEQTTARVDEQSQETVSKWKHFCNLKGTSINSNGQLCANCSDRAKRALKHFWSQPAN